MRYCVRTLIFLSGFFISTPALAATVCSGAGAITNTRGGDIFVQSVLDVNAGTCQSVRGAVAAFEGLGLAATSHLAANFERVSFSTISGGRRVPAQWSGDLPTSVSGTEVITDGIVIPDGQYNFSLEDTINGTAYRLEVLVEYANDEASIVMATASGGAFGPIVNQPPAQPAAANAAQQALEQQILGAGLLRDRAFASYGNGVSNAIAERFFGGDGTQLSVSSNGSAASAYISMHGIGQAAQDMRARRLAMYETSPDALQAIDAAFLNASMEHTDERSEGADEGSSHLLGYAGTPSFGEEESRWNIWARGTYTHYDGDAFSGDTWNGIAGIDYLLTETVLIGALAGYESGDFTFQTTNGAFDGAGFTTGVYVGVQLAENLVMDAFLTHAWLDYDNRAGTATGDTDATRLMVSVNVTGQYELAEGVILEPNARLFYAHEEQEAYILSDTTAVAANSIDSGRLSIGPRLRYAFQDSAYNHWSLFVSAHGEYDLSTENQTNTALPDFDGLLSARVGAGINGTFYNGWSFSLAGDVGGIGSGDFLSYTGTGNIRIPFN